MAERRVVVTGIGLVTPVGNNVESSWSAILAGRSGVNLIENFDTTDFSCKFAAQVKNYDPSPLISSKETRKMDYFIQYGITASHEALLDSGIEITDANADRIGVAIGAGIGGLGQIEHHHSVLLNKGPKRMNPFFIPSVIINMVAGNVSIKLGMRGPNISIVSACTTGTHNIGYAGRAIQHGDADVMFAGGAEMASTPLGISGFGSIKALSTRNDSPETASRPFDVDRDGFVLADGAGVLVLEELSHAKKRGAKIYAELTGFGSSADASHMTMPDQSGRGARACMSAALKDSKLSSDAIEYINAHGTSTPPNDRIETLAIKQTFPNYGNLAVSSTKSMIGHALGAAGAIEAAFCALAIRDQVAPPTINLTNPDPDCDLDYVANQARSMSIRHTLSNSFGFGGTNGSLIFSEF